MINVYDNANALAEDIQKTPQFVDLKKALEKIADQPESLQIYREMDKLQQEIMAAQQQGQGVSDDLKKRYSEVNQKVLANSDLKEMIDKEQAIFQLMNELQATITAPIGKLYDDVLKK